jgi:hypothetical protein
MGYGSRRIDTDLHGSDPVLTRIDPSKSVAHFRELIFLHALSGVNWTDPPSFSKTLKHIFSAWTDPGGGSLDLEKFSANNPPHPRKRLPIAFAMGSLHRREVSVGENFSQHIGGHWPMVETQFYRSHSQGSD